MPGMEWRNSSFCAVVIRLFFVTIGAKNKLYENMDAPITVTNYQHVVTSRLAQL
jgi:hypothetical protein